MIYLLLAQRLGLPISGVNLPSLFVLTYQTPQTQFYINVFNRGLIFSKNDIVNYIKQLNIESQDSFFNPCSHLEIVTRVLRNLIVSFEKISDIQRAKEIERILKLIQ